MRHRSASASSKCRRTAAGRTTARGAAEARSRQCRRSATTQSLGRAACGQHACSTCSGQRRLPTGGEQGLRVEKKLSLSPAAFGLQHETWSNTRLLNNIVAASFRSLPAVESWEQREDSNRARIAARIAGLTIKGGHKRAGFDSAETCVLRCAAGQPVDAAMSIGRRS